MQPSAPRTISARLPGIRLNAMINAGALLMRSGIMMCHAITSPVFSGSTGWRVKRLVIHLSFLEPSRRNRRNPESRVPANGIPGQPSVCVGDRSRSTPNCSRVSLSAFQTSPVFGSWTSGNGARRESRSPCDAPNQRLPRPSRQMEGSGLSHRTIYRHPQCSEDSSCHGTAMARAPNGRFMQQQGAHRLIGRAQRSMPDNLANWSRLDHPDGRVQQSGFSQAHCKDRIRFALNEMPLWSWRYSPPKPSSVHRL